MAKSTSLFCICRFNCAVADKLPLSVVVDTYVLPLEAFTL